MYILLGCLVAMAMAPSGDPRAIDPAANRPEIVAPGGGPTTGQPPKTRPPKRGTTPDPQREPGPTAVVGPEPRTAPGRTTNPKDELEPRRQGCFPERGRCRRLSAGGITATTVGVAMLGTGVGFMLAPQFPVPDEPISNYSLRPPGVVLVTVGAVSMVTGIVMLVAGRVVHEKSKQQTARVQLAPGGLRW